MGPFMSRPSIKCFSHAELVGEKMRLRPIRPKDGPPAYELLHDGAITRTLVWDGPASAEELVESYARREDWWQDGTGDYNFAIESPAEPGVLGSIQAQVIGRPQQISIGYWLGAPYWGRGYMTEAARLVTHFSFEHLDAVRVFAGVFVGNPASRRVLEKNGFHLDGTLRAARYKGGEWLDEWFFTLLRRDWEAEKEWYRPRSERVAPAA